MIREDIEDFPFECRTKLTWFFINDWNNKKVLDFYNVSGKSELVIFLKEIIDKKKENNFELFGVWNGQYSTDIFRIPIKIAYGKLNKEF